MSHLSQEDGGPTRGTQLSLSREVAGREPGTTESPWGYGLGGTPTPRYPIPGQSSTETDR